MILLDPWASGHHGSADKKAHRGPWVDKFPLCQLRLLKKALEGAVHRCRSTAGCPSFASVSSKLMRLLKLWSPRVRHLSNRTGSGPSARRQFNSPRTELLRAYSALGPAPRRGAGQPANRPSIHPSALSSSRPPSLSLVLSSFLSSFLSSSRLFRPWGPIVWL